MGERTDTHTAVDLPEAFGGGRVPGLVVAFSEGRGLVRAVRLEGRVRLGRDRDLELPADDAKASRCHAEVVSSGTGVTVTDLDSRNGTFIDGVRVQRRSTPAAVGSVLRFGRTLLVVVADVRPFLEERPQDDLLLGGPALDEARRLFATVGPSRVPVLIEGETGTGKELAAQAIHAISGRAGALCAVNCAALPGELVESELFGHARGAFSSSDRARKGLFRAADGGTLLLDEIGDLPLAAQAKLLRVLETGEVRSVGDDHATRVDTRVLAATNRDLSRMSQVGSFRSDLFHRIASAHIELPPLRAHVEDVPLLAEHFAKSDGMGFTARGMELLMTHRWPGNVRELRNVVAAAVPRAGARGADRIDAEDVVFVDKRADAANDGDIEQRLLAALSAASGNVSRVARELGMRRPAVYELLRRMGVDPARYRK
jgi:transcriptional regulator with GAF, ATPase, and Fis domain